MSSAVDTILNAVLQALDATPAQEREEALSAAITELINASGVQMDGGTLQSQLPASPDMINGIATLLHKKATTTRNKYCIYPFALPNISASGPCYYVDAQTGELMLLLHRGVKNSHEWFYSAGYMEVLPPNSEMLYPERVSEAVRNKAEEETVGIYLPTPDKEASLVDMQHTALPRQGPLKQLIHDEFKRLSAIERWDAVVTRLSDPDYLKALFKRHGIHWPEHIDLSSRSTFIRETWEETGLDLTLYPEAVIKFSKSLDVSIVGGIARLYNVDQLYFGYLGVLNHIPVIAKSTTETLETAWIAASDIYRDRKGNQLAIKNDSRPLRFTALRGLEYTLIGLLECLIEKVSLVQTSSGNSVPLFSNAAGVQAALIAYSSEHLAHINELIDISISADKTLPSQLDKDGQALFRSFIAAAKGLADKLTPIKLDTLIGEAKKRPHALITLLQGK